jgi:hypothetical protein
LRKCGYRVLDAFDATEARRVPSGGTMTVDVVLADANCLDGSRFTLAACIRAGHPAVGVVLVGSVARTAEKTGELCEDGPALSEITALGTAMRNTDEESPLTAIPLMLLTGFRRMGVLTPQRA